MRNTRPSFVRARTAFAALFVSTLGCAAQVSDDAETTDVGSVKQAASGDFYELGFGPSTSNYLPEKTVVLTFDDGPDWGSDTNEDYKKGYTWQVLDILKEEGVTATFFINRDNYASLDDPEMQETVYRMAAEGHELGSHTWHHYSIGAQSTHPYWDPGNEPADFIAGDLTADQIEKELNKVEESVDRIFGSGKIRLTLFRAPYGEPFQTGTGTVDIAKEVVGRHAVHIGWNLDTFDYQCGTETCATENVETNLPACANQSAVILAHSVQEHEVTSLKATIQYLKENGYKFWTVDQAVCAKFGKYSADLVDGTDSGNCNQSDPEPRPKPDLSDVPPIMGGDGSTGGDDGSTGGDDGSTGGDDGSTGGDDGDDSSTGGDDGDDSSSSDGEDSGGPQTVTVVKKGCSVGTDGRPGLAGFFALGVGLVIAGRRRGRKGR